jgi:hypothetical protein
MVRRSTRSTKAKPPSRLGTSPPRRRQSPKRRRSRSKSPASSKKKSSPKSVRKSVRKAGKKVRGAISHVHKRAAGQGHKIASKILPDKFTDKAAVFLPVAITASAFIERAGVLAGTAAADVITTTNMLQLYMFVGAVVLFKDYCERNK